MRAFTPLFAVLVAGCAALPNTDRIGELGKATTAATAFAKDSITANRTLGNQLLDEEQALKFVNSGKLDFSEQPTDILNPDRIAARMRVLNALQEYGDALAEAAKQGQVDKLQSAAENLGNAAAPLIGAVSGAGPIAVPVVKVVARGFGFFLGNTYAAEINAIVQRSNPTVLRICDLLKKDFSELEGHLKRQVDDYKKHKKASLDFLRASHAEPYSLYGEVKTARHDIAAATAYWKAAGKFTKSFEDLKAAHDALANNKPDADLTLRNFLKIMADIAEIAKVANKEKSS